MPSEATPASAATPRCAASPTEYPTVRPAVRRSYRQDPNAARKPSARAEAIADQEAEIPTYRRHRRNSAIGTLCERRKEVTYERSFPQATGARGEVANIRDQGGLKHVEANRHSPVGGGGGGRDPSPGGAGRHGGHRAGRGRGGGEPP